MEASEDSGRKVIFVGGTSFSGSTLLDMMLANDSRGFSCGEVFALFRPHRPHHFHVECGCGDEACRIWDAIKKAGERDLYRSIFQMFPHVRLIVDSSKDPFWIHTQSARLAGQGITSRHLLIWKSPAEIRMSFRKRGREAQWARSWINYHRLYLKLIPAYGSLPYAVLATEPDSLKAVCRYAGIDYFAGKHEYWRRVHHTLFGNASAKIHTRVMRSGEYETDLAFLVGDSNVPRFLLERDFQTIYYHPPDDTQAASTSISRYRQTMLAGITDQLKAHDVRSSETVGIHSKAPSRSVKFGPLNVLVRRVNGRVRGTMLRQLHRVATLLHRQSLKPVCASLASRGKRRHSIAEH